MKLYEGESITDYSNSCIYKIYCINREIENIYIGSTTDFRQRYMKHRACCINNSNNKKNNLLLYIFMRENGGVDNWEMEIIEKFSCKTKKELLLKEQEYIDKLNPTLNSQNSINKKKDLIKEQEQSYIQKKEWYKKNKERILKKRKEYYENNKKKINEKYKQKFNCPCGRKVNFSGKIRHLKTKKHQDYLILNNINETKTCLTELNNSYKKKNELITCSCGSSIKQRSLERHLKTKKHQDYLSSKSNTIVAVPNNRISL
jgi:predicted GIY-YIG superfamily endonuclease